MSSSIRGYPVFVSITRLGLGFVKIWIRFSPRIEYCPSGLDPWCGWWKENTGGKPLVYHDIIAEDILEVIKSVCALVRLTARRRSHFYRNVWTCHPRRCKWVIPWHPVAALPEGAECWIGVCRFSANIAVTLFDQGAHCWRMWSKNGAAFSETRACRGTSPFAFTTSNVRNQKDQEKEKENQERQWDTGGGCWKSNLWAGGLQLCSPLVRRNKRHKHGKWLT